MRVAETGLAAVMGMVSAMVLGGTGMVVVVPAMVSVMVTLALRMTVMT